MRQAFKTLDEQIDEATFSHGPDVDAAIAKLSGGRLEPGARITWYHDDDMAHWGNSLPHPKDWLYSGIIIPIPDVELRGELQIEDCVVVVTEYPCEKCYVEVDWVSLQTLLQTPGLKRAHVMERVIAMKGKQP